jgi:hypothetical protein
MFHLLLHLLCSFYGERRRYRPGADGAAARILLGGVELMHMIAKGQMEYAGSQLPPFAQFYSLLA